MSQKLKLYVCSQCAFTHWLHTYNINISDIYIIRGRTYADVENIRSSEIILRNMFYMYVTIPWKKDIYITENYIYVSTYIWEIQKIRIYQKFTIFVCMYQNFKMCVCSIQWAVPLQRGNGILCLPGVFFKRALPKHGSFAGETRQFRQPTCCCQPILTEHISTNLV